MIDGKATFCSININITKFFLKAQIGWKVTYTSFGFWAGKLYKLKVVKENKNFLNLSDGVSPIYQADAQVFTPPLFPNTIL